MKKEFSKVLLIQESVLIWIMTISLIVMAFICICSGSFAELPWITAMVGFPWSAYGISQMFYYKKSLKENVKDGIKYETVMEELRQKEVSQYNVFCECDEDDDSPPVG